MSPRRSPLSSLKRLSLLLGVWPVLALGSQLLSGCGETVEVGFDDELGLAGIGGAAGSGSGGLSLSGSANGGDAGTPSAGGRVACEPVECRGRIFDCGNCNDDDDDGRIDAFDAECLGPCDDDELGFGTGLHGASQPCRSDCYFDGDSGLGNDRCEWSAACDPVSLAPSYPPSGDERCAYTGGGVTMGVDCARAGELQAEACSSNCLPLVPNGCDCFGCCELPAGSGEFHFVGIGDAATAGCELSALDDAARCPACTPVESCRNRCEECEPCVGRELDPSCPSAGQCPEGQSACVPEQGCDVGEYCVTGCCVRAPEPT